MKNKNESFEKWNVLYDKHINNDFNDWDEYFKVKMKLKRKFLSLIIKYSDSKPILECGCGTGKTSIFLSKFGLDTYAMDLEIEMVNKAKEKFREKASNCKFNVFEGDIKNIPFSDKFFSVTHSSGVMEHFSDEEIIEIINEELRVSDYCIFSVPTSYFEKKMLGNERFLSRKEWRKIISKSNAKIIKETGYHYKTFKNRFLDVVRKPSRLFKPIALYVFVLKERTEK